MGELIVDLRGRDMRVSEQFLDGTQLFSFLEHEHGEGVTQHMRCQSFDMSRSWKPDAELRFRNIAIKELP